MGSLSTSTTFSGTSLRSSSLFASRSPPDSCGNQAGVFSRMCFNTSDLFELSRTSSSGGSNVFQTPPSLYTPFGTPSMGGKVQTALKYPSSLPTFNKFTMLTALPSLGARMTSSRGPSFPFFSWASIVCSRLSRLPFTHGDSQLQSSSSPCRQVPIFWPDSRQSMSELNALSSGKNVAIVSVSSKSNTMSLTGKCWSVCSDRISMQFILRVSLYNQGSSTKFFSRAKSWSSCAPMPPMSSI
mmetsp:Transcript_99045/g.284724  ORF Transcript_99045/g.284724 Transcript_99045/m.284724 type:complete len:241 (-) Transcript_99045:940-1662(-)